MVAEANVYDGMTGTEKPAVVYRCEGCGTGWDRPSACPICHPAPREYESQVTSLARDIYADMVVRYAVQSSSGDRIAQEALALAKAFWDEADKGEK